MPTKDKLIQKAGSARHYEKNKAKIKARARLFSIMTRKRRARFIWAYKYALGCARCSEHDPACLDFHHLRDKETTIAMARVNGWSLERLIKEIEKCILLCANCHRKLHGAGGENGNPQAS